MQVRDRRVHQERLLQLHALEADLAQAETRPLRQERCRQRVSTEQSDFEVQLHRFSGVASTTA